MAKGREKGGRHTRCMGGRFWANDEGRREQGKGASVPEVPSHNYTFLAVFLIASRPLYEIIRCTREYILISSPVDYLIYCLLSKDISGRGKR